MRLKHKAASLFGFCSTAEGAALMSLQLQQKGRNKDKQQSDDSNSWKSAGMTQNKEVHPACQWTKRDFFCSYRSLTEMTLKYTWLIGTSIQRSLILFDLFWYLICVLLSFFRAASCVFLWQCSHSELQVDLKVDFRQKRAKEKLSCGL